MSRSILKQSSKIGFFALISRCIAFMREIFLIRFFSVGETSDIFFTAFRIPNTMRKIFAEGSLSSVLVPALISAHHKNGDQGLNRLTTFSFLIIESIMLLFCGIIFYFAPCVIHLIVPGFGAEKIQASVHLLRILISFILFMSSGAIFAAALQSQHKFFIPALAPSILNVLYVASLIVCLYFKLSVTAFCYTMIMTSVVFFLLHLLTYAQSGYGFAASTEQTKLEFKMILKQFLPCFLSVGIVEINHFINTAFCSYFASGSLTLLRYTFQFVNIPIGIITTSLVTVLLPHFSKLHLEKPQDLAGQLFEAMKFIIWTTMPLWFLMAFFSREIFHTLFLGDAQAMSKVPLAQSIFMGYLVGLLFFSLNKVFLSIFYALRLTMVPLCTTFVSIGVNYSLNRLLMQDYGAAGIAFSCSMAAMVQSVVFLIVLHKRLALSWPRDVWILFLTRYAVQLVTCISIFWFLYVLVRSVVISLHFDLNLHFVQINQDFFILSLGYWLWVGPLVGIFLGLLYFSRRFFGIRLSYFE
ncbi:murein biosynthesis integral membrane protein MurJ [candidate division TM6 bacterium RIFCSPHIGHO2_12_FULL_38_8]|nr:MAG: murein biosynthesis integral membrane protein MurJ [candidate division TM6 bacterium RIFCSPHIGHO2_12_FULL_38_8]